MVIPNAARDPQDLAVQANEATTTFSRLILAIGRMTEQKGFDLLLDAFYRSDLAQKGWHLTILGEGPERSALEQQATKLGVADVVSLPGFVDVGQWLGRSDIFVLSSRYEGFPNALMEAMQMHRACVSFDCPSGPRELIESDRNGLLIPPQDVIALSEALQRLAADPVLRRRLGAEASKIGEQFSPALVYAKWLELIDTVSAENQCTTGILPGPTERMSENRSIPAKGRILFVVGSLNFGGAEGQLAMLAERLKARGWMVDVFLLEKSGSLVEQLERAGIRVSDGGYRFDRPKSASRSAFVCVRRD